MAKFDTTSGASGAVSGAQIGATVGGPWGALAGGIIGAGAGFLSNQPKRQQLDPRIGDIRSRSLGAQRDLFRTADRLMRGEFATPGLAERQEQILAARRMGINKAFGEAVPRALEPMAATGFLSSGRAAEQTRRLAAEQGFQLSQLEAQRAEEEINRLLQQQFAGIQLQQQLAALSQTQEFGAPQQFRKPTAAEQFLPILAQAGELAGQYGAQKREQAGNLAARQDMTAMLNAARGIRNPYASTPPAPIPGAVQQSGGYWVSP